ncbi:MAG: type VI secretion system tip protein VgrG, partial [Bacteroidota bacterium]
RNRMFLQQKDAEMMESIVGEYAGLDKSVTATTEQHPEVVQYHCTDWDFILSRAELNGMVVNVKDSKLTVEPPTTSGSEVLTFTYGANLLAFETEMDVRTQFQATKATAWSYTDQQLIEETSSEPSVPPHGNLGCKDLGQILDLQEYELVHGGKVTDQELKNWADAMLLKSRLAKIQGRLHSQGSLLVQPNTLVQIAGLGDRFNGLAFVSGVRHEIRNGNWLTWTQVGLSPDWFADRPEILAAPASGLLPGIRGLQIGVVLQIEEDPDGEDRILIQLPIVDPQGEGIWARVASMDAGNERGMFFRPEVGDELVVGFLNDDPRDPIVLGMLHSSQLPAPLQAEATNPEKGYISREQLKLLFNDEVKSITLATPGGHSLVMDDEGGAIEVTDSNGNTLTMDSAGITLKSAKDLILEAQGKVTVKATQDLSLEGMNVNAKASAQFKATGNGGAEVSTSAVAVLKGSLVQIN